MRKTAYLAVLLALLALLAACGSSDDKQNGGEDNTPPTVDHPNEDGDTDEDEQPDGSDTEDGKEDGSNALPDENGPVQVKKDADGKITVDFLIEAAAKKDVSVLVLSDEGAVDSWRTDSDKVLAIEQITADASGKGSVTVTAKQASACVVVVSYAGGREMVALQ